LGVELVLDTLVAAALGTAGVDVDALAATGVVVGVATAGVAAGAAAGAEAASGLATAADDASGVVGSWAQLAPAAARHRGIKHALWFMGTSFYKENALTTCVSAVRWITLSQNYGAMRSGGSSDSSGTAGATGTEDFVAGAAAGSGAEVDYETGGTAGAATGAS